MYVCIVHTHTNILTRPLLPLYKYPKAKFSFKKNIAVKIF